MVSCKRLRAIAQLTMSLFRHLYMLLSEVITLAVYIISMWFLPEYFNMSFVLSARFIWKTALIVAVSSFPLYLITSVKHRLAPASYAKLRV